MSQVPPLATVADQLRLRLGNGARFDAEGAPEQALRFARHGMAFFSRQLNGLSDNELSGPSRLRGWSRAHLIAYVSIASRTQALALAGLRGQVPGEDFDWEPDVDLTATLPPRALRHLFDHATVHLNVEWRDLSSDNWSETVTLLHDEHVKVSDLPMRQAGLLWWGAVALRASATIQEIPHAVTVPSGPLQAAAHETGSGFPGQAGGV
jgi:maleylpyruvate isomerase